MQHYFLYLFPSQRVLHTNKPPYCRTKYLRIKFVEGEQRKFQWKRSDWFANSRCKLKTFFLLSMGSQSHELLNRQWVKYFETWTRVSSANYAKICRQLLQGALNFSSHQVTSPSFPHVSVRCFGFCSLDSWRRVNWHNAEETNIVNDNKSVRNFFNNN